MARQLESVFEALPAAVQTIYARADSGFYYWEAVAANANRQVQFIVSARKTSRWVDELKATHWQRSPRTDADGQCEFWYQPEGWPKAYRFIALRWRPRSGATQAESVSATAITMPGSAQECAGLADGRGYPVHSAVCGTTRRQW